MERTVTRVLLTYDGSEQSRRVLRYTEWLTAGDSVSLISVTSALVEGPRGRPPTAIRRTTPPSTGDIGRHGMTAV